MPTLKPSHLIAMGVMSGPYPVTKLRRLREFIAVFRQYRRAHSAIYAARIAYGCAFRNLPF